MTWGSGIRCSCGYDIYRLFVVLVSVEAVEADATVEFMPVLVVVVVGIVVVVDLIVALASVATIVFIAVCGAKVLVLSLVIETLIDFDIWLRS